MDQGAQKKPPRMPERAATRLTASSVLQGAREVILIHGAAEYHLKVTNSGKLILTK
jgi:hemin uptake protein HemP